MKLETLEPGQRFRLPDAGRSGTLLSIGLGGCRVQYDGAREVTLTDWREVKTITFKAKGKPTVISGATEVEAI